MPASRRIREYGHSSGDEIPREGQKVINNLAVIPQRWITVLACFLSLLNSCNVQICLSIAIIQMVEPINTVSSNNKACQPEIIEVQSYRNETFTKGETFDWDEKAQGQILSSYYWGYIITCILGGSILDKLGGKHTMGTSILSTALLTLMVPKSVEWADATSLTIIRFLTGLGSGMLNPAIMRLMSRWIPKDERSWAAAWAFSGGICGIIVGMGGSGIIIQRSGWPTMFYTYGGFGIVVFFAHCAICYDSPYDHPFISKVEFKFLKEKLKHSYEDLPPTPWRRIIRSKPVWAVLVALIGNSWCHITVVSDIPKFMSSVLKFNVETNGYVSAIPHIYAWIVSCTLSWIADRLIAKNITSTTWVRKIGNSIAMLGTSTFLLVATYVGCNRTLVVGLHVVAMIMFSCINFSTLVNALDLAPNYAGAIQGILLGISISVGLVSPYVAGLLIPNQTVDEWRIVFWLVFVICVATNLIFFIFGSAEVQDWNDPNYLKYEEHGKNANVKENIKLVTKKMPRNDIV
ncbi:sialin-like [Phymastichus coffea]|uniref:sialin-like n=1 Tax=Phymastichus coffea TaxID=108790 RepID=UPI00273C988B|nr:sialin-like [Phymastichus coffea]